MPTIHQRDLKALKIGEEKEEEEEEEGEEGEEEWWRRRGRGGGRVEGGEEEWGRRRRKRRRSGGGGGGRVGVEKRGLIPEQRLLIESTLKSDAVQLTALSFCSST